MPPDPDAVPYSTEPAPQPVVHRLLPRDITALEPLLLVGRGDGALHLRWYQLEKVAAAPRWPFLTITYRPSRESDDDLHAIELRPRRQASAAEFEQSVRAVVDLTADRRPSILDPGWLEDDHLEWEPVHALPGAQRQGSYRDPAERVLARRSHPGSLETLLHWLASTPAYPFRMHPVEIAVTPTYVYQRRRDGITCRVPLDALRRREGATRLELAESSTRIRGYVCRGGRGALGWAAPLLRPYRRERSGRRPATRRQPRVSMIPSS